MLVLARKPEQRLFIQPPGHPPIEVKVLTVEGRCVRLGISAPKSFDIWREELATEDRPMTKPKGGA